MTSSSLRRLIGSQRLARSAGWFTTRRLQSRTRLTEVSAELATVREALRSADGEAQVRRVRLAEARLALEAARQQLEVARATREAAERNRARSDAEAAAVQRDTERLSAEVAAAEREVFAVEQIRATPAPPPMQRRQQHLNFLMRTLQLPGVNCAH